MPVAKKKKNRFMAEAERLANIKQEMNVAEEISLGLYDVMVTARDEYEEAKGAFEELQTNLEEACEEFAAGEDE